MNRRPHTAGLSSGIHDDSAERMVLLSRYDAMRKVAVVPYCFVPTERAGRCLCRSVTPEPGRWRPNLCGLHVGSGEERKLSMNVEPARAFRDNDNCMNSSSCASSSLPSNTRASPVPPSFELGAKGSQRWSLTLEDFYTIARFTVSAAARPLVKARERSHLVSDLTCEPQGGDVAQYRTCIHWNGSCHQRSWPRRHRAGGRKGTERLQRSAAASGQ